MGKIVYGMISPHPPLLIPEIGGGRIKEVEKTDASLRTAAKSLVSAAPDTTIIITPHGYVSQNTVRVYAAKTFAGDFSMFGIPSAGMSCAGDIELAVEVTEHCLQKGLRTESIQEPVLDHGIMVPLHYMQKAGYGGRVVPIAIALAPLRELFEFGSAAAEAVRSSGKKVAVVASADMSHRLTKDAPSGYSPKGSVFDSALVDMVKNNDVKGLLSFDGQLAEEAGQDALWSIAMLMGMMDTSGLKPELLSYEGPFGVGYMVADFKKRG